ncbi:hypothetical protein ASO17_24415 [Salmonella enterica subsp. enterica serovar Infantis]|nr:hypothetical protein ASO17_24415 [Salmonella enterica subsp. enterica serovar Infantis]
MAVPFSSQGFFTLNKFGLQASQRICNFKYGGGLGLMGEKKKKKQNEKFKKKKRPTKGPFYYKK